MKILKDNKIYVQKNDIAFLNHIHMTIPSSIHMRANGIIDNRNRYEFEEFTDPTEVEFFKRIDWIVDYNRVKDLTEEELLTFGRSIAEQRNLIANKYNEIPMERKGQYFHLVEWCDTLEFKMKSLRDMIMFKRGELDFVLPSGVERPRTVIQESTGIKKTPGIKRLFKLPKKSDKK